MTLQLHGPRRAARHRRESTILSLATATPLHVPQALVTELSVPLCCDNTRQEDFLRRVYLHSGVTYRSSVIPTNEADPVPSVTAFYPARRSAGDRGPTTAQRMTVYAQHAPCLAEESSRRAVEQAQLASKQITHVVSASCTGFYAPGLDIELIQRLHLRPDVQRMHLGFMGCHAAFNALAAARQVALANPAACILVCCTELCSLHLAYGFDPQKIVANALFSDGSAAAVVAGAGARNRGVKSSERQSRVSLLGAASLLLPSPDAMTWTIGNHGFAMTLSPSVPELIRERLPAWVDGVLARHDLTLSDVAHFAIHPGGPKILSAVQSALRLPDVALAASRQVLSDHGNMSSATILFVLQYLREHGATGRCLALGFGPGLMCEALLLTL